MDLFYPTEIREGQIIKSDTLNHPHVLEQRSHAAGSMNRKVNLRVRDLHAHVTCSLCSGYFVDATTIIECLHSFCRTCVVRYLSDHKSCPKCNVQVHKTRPLLNIRSDKTLQEIVYKLVPNLRQDEMRRRRKFWDDNLPIKNDVYRDLKPEDLGEADEGTKGSFVRKICLSIEPYKWHNKRLDPESDWDELERTMPKRYLRCVPDVSIAHLHKLVRMKFKESEGVEVLLFYGESILPLTYTIGDIVEIFPLAINQVLELRYSLFAQKSLKRKRNIVWEKVDAMLKLDNQSPFSPNADSPKKRKVASATPQLKAFFNSQLPAKQAPNLTTKLARKSPDLSKSEVLDEEAKPTEAKDIAVTNEIPERPAKLQLLEMVQLKTVDSSDAPADPGQATDSGINGEPEKGPKASDPNPTKATEEPRKSASPLKPEESTKQNGSAVTPPKRTSPTSAKAPDNSTKSGKSANVKCYTMLDIPVDEAVRRKPPTPVEIPDDSPNVAKRQSANHDRPDREELAKLLPFVQREAPELEATEVKAAPQVARVNRRKPTHPVHHAASIGFGDIPVPKTTVTPFHEPKTTSPSIAGLKTASLAAHTPVVSAAPMHVPKTSVAPMHGSLRTTQNDDFVIPPAVSQPDTTSQGAYETLRISSQQSRSGQFILLTAPNNQHGELPVGKTQAADRPSTSLAPAPPVPRSDPYHVQKQRPVQAVQPSQQARSRGPQQNTRPAVTNSLQSLSNAAAHRRALDAVRSMGNVLRHADKKVPQAKRPILPKASLSQPPALATNIDGIPQVKHATPTRNIFENEKVTYPMGSFGLNTVPPIAPPISNTILSRPIAPKPTHSHQRAPGVPPQLQQRGSFSELKSHLESTSGLPASYLSHNNMLNGLASNRTGVNKPHPHQQMKAFVQAPKLLNTTGTPPSRGNQHNKVPIYPTVNNRQDNIRHRPAILSHNADRRSFQNVQRNLRPDNRNAGADRRSLPTGAQIRSTIDARISDALSQKHPPQQSRSLAPDPYQQTTIERAKAYVRSLTQQKAATPSSSSANNQRTPLVKPRGSYPSGPPHSSISRSNLVSALRKPAQHVSALATARDAHLVQRREQHLSKGAQRQHPRQSIEHGTSKSVQRRRSSSHEAQSISIFSPPMGTKSPWSSRGYPLPVPDETRHSEYTPPIKKTCRDPPKAHQSMSIVKSPAATKQPNKQATVQPLSPDIMPLELTARTRRVSDLSSTSSPVPVPTPSPPTQATAEQPLCLVMRKA